MYILSYGTESEQHDTRAGAIEAAKDASSNNRGQVVLEDETGRETFIYRHGELETYTYELRFRRRP